MTYGAAKAHASLEKAFFPLQLGSCEAELATGATTTGRSYHPQRERKKGTTNGTKKKQAGKKQSELGEPISQYNLIHASLRTQ